ncbi:HNH endonuclease [Robbsia andropogonis]|uniref:HNH endonuclease n=1 Tax=Robbsia andropogonis TaxID=28092 RepID=UPI00389A65C2
MPERLTGRAGTAQRTRIRKRDCYQCRICSIAVRVGEVDHILALVNGGTNDDSNLWLLCYDCHRDKTRSDLGYKVKTAIKPNGMPINPGHHWNT